MTWIIFSFLLPQLSVCMCMQCILDIDNTYLTSHLVICCVLVLCCNNIFLFKLVFLGLLMFYVTIFPSVLEIAGFMVQSASNMYKCVPDIVDKCNCEELSKNLYL